MRTPPVVLLLGALFLTLPAPLPAWSSGGHYGHSGGRHSLGHSGGHYSPGHSGGHYFLGHSGYHGGYRDHDRHRGYAHPGYTGDRAYLSGRREGHGRGCESVSKHGTWEGREARIGGTRCYDRYGEAYVVPGSRYLIESY